MDKKQKKHVENKPILIASKSIKCNGSINVPERPKKGCKRLKKGQKPSSSLFVGNPLISYYSALLSLLCGYSLNDRVSIYVLLTLLSVTEPLSLSAITRYSGVSQDKYTLQGVNRLVGLGLVDRVLSPKPVYCLSVSCKEQLMQLIDGI